MTRKTKRPAALVFVAAALLAADSARAQSVRAEISSEQAEVGEVLDLYITIVNPSQATAPAPPKTRDFDIRIASVTPSESTQVRIVNGQMTREVSYTYRYSVRPLRNGNLVVPPFIYKEKGRTFTSRPIPVSVGQATAGPFVLCEVEIPRNVAYIGEPVPMALKIYVRQFQQVGYGVLDASQMWTLRDRACQWGVFADGNLSPGVQEVRRKDDAGVERDFYVFSVETTIYPNKSGPFDFGEIEFIYKYPLQLSRSLMGYQIERARRIAATPTLPELTIEPIPTEGRPPDFNGAIGVYSITTSAKPTEIPVGDPITLSLSIRGAGSLERLTPPRLDQVAALTRDFEVSSDIPAGRIENDRKFFAVTIRPLREDVKQIPAIPMSYFNPATARFETALSRPIPITVTTAVRLALPESPQSDLAQGAGVLAPLVETTEGLFPNYDRPEAVLANQSASLGTGVWVLLLVMPLAYVATWIVQSRSARLRNNEALRRRSQALGAAKKLLQSPQAESPGTVRAAVMGYIADCCNVPAGGLTRSEAVRLAASRGLPRDVTERLDRFIEDLEYAEYGGSAAAPAAPAGRALGLIQEMEQAGFR